MMLMVMVMRILMGRAMDLVGSQDMLLMWKQAKGSTFSLVKIF